MTMLPSAIATNLPSLTSFQSFRVYLKADKALERLVLPQLDILLDKPTTSPRHVYPTAPLRIHRVSEVVDADVELVYDANTRTLVVFPRETAAVSFEGMDQFPLTFDEASLRRPYNGSGSPLPPLVEYLCNAARTFGLLKHSNIRDGPLDMRSEVALWMSPLVRGLGTPLMLPSCGKDMIPSDLVDLFIQSKGDDYITQDVRPDEGYGILVANNNPNALYVAIVKAPSMTLNPEICFHAQLPGDGGEALLFERDASGDVRGLLRFGLHAGQSFNVDMIFLVLSSEPIGTVEEMLAEERAWDGMSVAAVCRLTDDDSDTDTIGYQEEELDITDALIHSAKGLKL